MPTPSAEQRLLTTLAAPLANPSLTRAYEREGTSERALDRRALLAAIDDLEAAGLLASKLVLRITRPGANGRRCP